MFTLSLWVPENINQTVDCLGQWNFPRKWRTAHCEERGKKVTTLLFSPRYEITMNSLRQSAFSFSWLTDPALARNNKIPIMIHCTLGNIVPEVRLRDLVARIQLDSDKIWTSSYVRGINPLTIKLVAIDIETSGSYALVTTPGAIPFLFEAGITFSVL